MENQALPILSVKFKIPEPRKNYVSRKRLMDKLRIIEKKKVTIIKAGAGSGKTTLLSSYIKESTIPDLVWITLADNMNQVFIFWKYVLEGTKCYLGNSVTDFQNMFDGNVQKDNLWSILSMYLNKMTQTKDIILILDDFQMISEQFLLSTIDFFIANMPDNLHLVLLTRSLPSLYLGAISMDDNLLLIDENEIRMSESESKEFLTQTLEFNSDEDRIQSMINDSNGWVGGLQLMAVAAKEQRRSIIPDLNTTDRIIGDYISNEIYRYLTNEEQDFLQKTSLLGYFNQKICEKYISQYNFNEIMGSILRKNLFVVSIDEEARVYRYHSIMKDYLTSLFNQDMEQKIQLHNQAADIFFELGDFDESLSHLFAIHAYEKIMKQLLKMPQNVLTYSYMMTVPLEELSKNRDFAYQYFFCSYASMDVDACESIYQYIIKHLKDDDTFSAFKHSDLFFNVNLMYLNVNTLSLEQIDAMPLNLVTKAYLLIKESYFLFLGDQSSEAFLYLDKAQEIYEETTNPFIGVFVLSEKTQILESNGELKQALLMYKKMEKFLESVPTLKSSYYIGLAGVYIKQLALTKAKETLVLAQETLGGNVTNLNCAYLYTLAELSYTIGEHEKTEQIISDLSKEELYQNIFITARLLRYPIYRGNHNRLAVQFAKDYEAADNLLKNLDVQLLYAGIIYDNGEENKALQIVDSLIARARKTQNKLKIVEGDLLKTRFLLEHEGRAREVLNIFLEAVAYAYENTIAIPFWFEKETVEIIINKFHVDIEKKLSTTELKFIQECIKDNKENDLEIVTVKGYDLTEREIEVLEEMKKGYSNKQIAENLCISLATVKSHIINIYGKLGVNNRVAAINKINS